MILSVCNQKGGVAKTTSAINTASCLAELGKSVLVIDLDPQKNLGTSVGIDVEDGLSVYELLLDDEVKCKDVIRKTDFGFDIIPAKLQLANAEVELADIPNRETLLRDKLNSIKTNYDFIIIDCNPALGFLTINALVASDKVIIPMEAAAFSLDGLDTLVTLIRKIQRVLNRRLEVLGILLTRVNPLTRINATFKNELKNIFGDKLLSTKIHNNVKIVEAQMESMPINFYDKKCKGYKDYKKLSKEILSYE